MGFAGHKQVGLAQLYVPVSGTEQMGYMTLFGNRDFADVTELRGGHARSERALNLLFL